MFHFSGSKVGQGFHRSHAGLHLRKPNRGQFAWFYLPMEANPGIMGAQCFARITGLLIWPLPVFLELSFGQHCFFYFLISKNDFAVHTSWSIPDPALWLHSFKKQSFLTSGFDFSFIDHFFAPKSQFFRRGFRGNTNWPVIPNFPAILRKEALPYSNNFAAFFSEGLKDLDVFSPPTKFHTISRSCAVLRKILFFCNRCVSSTFINDLRASMPFPGKSNTYDHGAPKLWPSVQTHYRHHLRHHVQ